MSVPGVFSLAATVRVAGETEASRLLVLHDQSDWMVPLRKRRS